MRVQINHTRYPSIPHGLVKRVMAAAAAAVPRYRHAGVSVAFVADAVSRRLNRQYRHIDRPTDVLSFPERDAKPIFLTRGYIGEIVIAVPQTRRQARELLHPFTDEVAALLIHGWLHLIGYDHINKSDARRMRGLAKRIWRAYELHAR
ncbi:MAG: rRNA maturation RNase YbeY [Patescibacteria group bacterium]